MRLSVRRRSVLRGSLALHVALISRNFVILDKFAVFIVRVSMIRLFSLA
jgi:hypothetical protein